MSDSPPRSAPETSGSHPSDALLAGYLDRALPDQERHAVESHLDVCAYCRRALAEVAAIVDGAPADTSPAPAPAAMRRRGAPAWTWAALAAASVLLAVGLFGPTADEARRSPERVRESGRNPLVDEALPRIEVLFPQHGTTLARSMPRFAWLHADVADYRFFLLSEDGTPVWSQVTRDTALTLPPNVPLEPGRSYFWYVDAMANGRSATTRVQRVTVVE